MLVYTYWDNRQLNLQLGNVTYILYPYYFIIHLKYGNDIYFSSTNSLVLLRNDNVGFYEPGKIRVAIHFPKQYFKLNVKFQVFLLLKWNGRRKQFSWLTLLIIKLQFFTGYLKNKKTSNYLKIFESRSNIFLNQNEVFLQ